MRYLKCRWAETRGDDFDDWGFTTFYFEVDEDLSATRQIEIYDNGNALKNDYKHHSDKFGILAGKSLEGALEAPNTVEISQDEFENIWASQKAFNRR